MLNRYEIHFQGQYQCCSVKVVQIAHLFYFGFNTSTIDD